MSEWKKELAQIINASSLSSRAERENALFETFVKEVAMPALSEIAEELNALGRITQVRATPGSAQLVVKLTPTIEETSFRVVRRMANTGVQPGVEVRVLRNQRSIRTEASFRPEGEPYTIKDITGDEIIETFLKYYRQVKDQ